MSKPNLLSFGSSVGIYRNKRMRDLHKLLAKSIPIKIDFAELAPMLFQVVMAYAGENQIDGNFADYTIEDWCEIFAVNHVRVTPGQANAIVKGFAQVGLFDHQKIRSWMKYNRHLADYEGIVKAKRLAGKLSAKKRQKEAQAALENQHETNGKAVQEPAKNGVKTDSVAAASKQLWLIEKALETAKGKARGKLFAQKQALLSGELGVDLSEPSLSPAARSKATKPEKPLTDAEILEGAEYLVSVGKSDLLVRAQREALARKEARNPVPG